MGANDAARYLASLPGRQESFASFFFGSTYSVLIQCQATPVFDLKYLRHDTLFDARCRCKGLE